MTPPSLDITAWKRTRKSIWSTNTTILSNYQQYQLVRLYPIYILPWCFYNRYRYNIFHHILHNSQEYRQLVAPESNIKFHCNTGWHEDNETTQHTRTLRARATHTHARYARTHTWRVWTFFCDKTLKHWVDSGDKNAGKFDMFCHLVGEGVTKREWMDISADLTKRAMQ